MKVTTIWRFARPPEVVWPLLCNSRIEPAHGLLFRLGLPRPRQCRLPTGQGGVGSTRQCVSDRGVIDQTILAWEEPHHLAFRMDRTDMRFRSFVASIVDDFTLVATPAGGTLATRTTSVEVTGSCRLLKRALLRLGLRRIHRAVFQAWAQLAAAPAAT